MLPFLRSCFFLGVAARYEDAYVFWVKLTSHHLTSAACVFEPEAKSCMQIARKLDADATRDRWTRQTNSAPQRWQIYEIIYEIIYDLVW